MGVDQDGEPHWTQ